MVKEKTKRADFTKDEKMLFHKDTGFPKEVEQVLSHAKNRNVVIPLKYGPHAKEAAKKDRYGKINLENNLHVADATPIEVEVKGNKITKVLFRKSHDPKHDVTYVVNPEDGFVRTAWLNRKDDKHTTLDTSKYTKVR